jgi:hypothetical protein
VYQHVTVQLQRIHLRSGLQVRHFHDFPTTHPDWTGLRVELHPRGRFRPSREMHLTVDGVVISVAFHWQSHERLKQWTWEVVNETAV